MTQPQSNHDLSDRQKQEIDELALSRVEAMNSDEFFCQEIDQKVEKMEAHLRDYFHKRFAFHHKSNND